MLNKDIKRAKGGPVGDPVGKCTLGCWRQTRAAKIVEVRLRMLNKDIEGVKGVQGALHVLLSPATALRRN